MVPNLKLKVVRVGVNLLLLLSSPLLVPRSKNCLLIVNVFAKNSQNIPHHPLLLNKSVKVPVAPSKARLLAVEAVEMELP